MHSSEDSWPWGQVDEVIDAIERRPIIPFLGAGISLATGFPAIAALNQYLGRVAFAIRCGLHIGRYPDPENDSRDYERHPSHFLIHYGWPHPESLNADLCRWARDHYKEAEYSEVFGREPIHPRHAFEAIAQFEFREDLSRLDTQIGQAVRRDWREWCGGISDAPHGERKLLYGNWESLLDYLTEGNLDLTDQLFTLLEHGRSPSLAHHYLAFLQQKVIMPLILTLNFDTFVEQAFARHGISAKVFDIHRDANLPDPAIVKRQLSILKLHGSAYGLRLGERLKYPLDPVTKRHVLDCLPDDALLLVAGFSGYERRMMQLMNAIVDSGTARELRVIWIEPDAKNAKIKELIGSSGGKVKQVVKGANAFFQELYFRYASTYPASAVPYNAWLGRTVDEQLLLPPHRPMQKLSATAQDPRVYPVHVFGPEKLNDEKPCTSWASMAAEAFVRDKGYLWTPIWIDLESHHTLAGVVAEIFLKARILDPVAPQARLPGSNHGGATRKTEGAPDAITKVVERVVEVLTRGRYILVFDSIESFGREQTMHHGVPTFRDIPSDTSTTLNSAFSDRVADLEKFLTQLCSKYSETNRNESHSETQRLHIYGESYICVTVAGVPQPRRGLERTSEREHPCDTVKSLKKLVSKFVDGMTDSEVCRYSPRSVADPYHDFVPKPAKDTNEPEGPANALKMPIAGHARKVKEDSKREYEPDGRFPGKHWHRSAKTSDTKLLGRSNSRQKDIEALRDFVLTGKPGEHTPAARDAFLGLMSVMRRPRPWPLIRSLTERLILHNSSKEEKPINSARTALRCVEGLVADLCGQRGGSGQAVARWVAGGSLWLFRDVHEAAYSALTEELVAASPSSAPKAKPALKPLLRDGLVCIAWHWTTARCYYADMFRPTKHVDAFYEYLYHRIAALRCIKRVVAELNRKSVSRKEWHGTTVDELCKNLAVFTELRRRTTFKNQNGFRSLLCALHKHGVETLERALRRNRSWLKRVSTPQTLDSWASHILDRVISDLELKHRDPTLNGFRSFWEEIQLDAEYAQLRFQRVLTLGLRDRHNDDSCGGQEDLGSLRRTLKEYESKRQRSDEPVSQVRTLFRAAIALNLAGSAGTSGQNAETAADDRVDLTKILYKQIDTQQEDAERIDVRKQVRERQEDYFCFYELRTKNALRNFLQWRHAIEHRQLVSGKVRQEELKEELNDAIQYSFEYENFVRAHSNSEALDRRHRSSALCLRARANYLQGRFFEGHHWLDLAEADLTTRSSSENVSGAVTHIHRAELLTLSAQYRARAEGQDREGIRARTAGAERERLVYCQQKIDRAVREMDFAEALLGEERHQSQWLIRASIGAALVRIEKMVYDYLLWCDALEHASEGDLAVQKGAAERTILDVMQRLRSALDLLPYQPGTWEEIKDRCGEPLIISERLVYHLWHQLCVVSMFALNGPVTTENISLLCVGDFITETWKTRWQDLAMSLRFDGVELTLKVTMDQLRDVSDVFRRKVRAVRVNVPDTDSQRLRRPRSKARTVQGNVPSVLRQSPYNIIRVLLQGNDEEEERGIPTEEMLNKLWNARRGRDPERANKGDASDGGVSHRQSHEDIAECR